MLSVFDFKNVLEVLVARGCQRGAVDKLVIGS